MSVGDSSGLLAAILTSCVVHIPTLLVWIAGAVLAIMHWRKYPQVSMFTLAALGIFIVLTIAGSILSIWLPVTIMRDGMDSGRLGITLTISGCIQSLIAAGAWGLILAAIFKGRPAEASRNGLPQREQ
jgi:hypothetical protein